MPEEESLAALQEYVEKNELHQEVEAVDEQVEAEETPVESEQSEAEPVEEAEPEAQEAEAEAPELADSLQGLAEQLELDADDLKGLTVDFEVDGETRSMTIAEAIEQASTSNAVTAQSEQLAESQKTFNEQVEQATAMWQDRLQRIDSVVASLEGEMEAEPDLNQYLMDGDTETYLLEKARLEQKGQRLQAAQQARHQAAEEEQAYNAQRLQQHRQTEGQKLSNAFPELKDPMKQGDFDKRVEVAAIAYGYSSQEVQEWMQGYYDTRQVQALLDAHTSKMARDKQPALKKTLTALPKVRKPGTKRGADEVSQDKRKAQLAKIRKSGGEFDTVKELFNDFV